MSDKDGQITFKCNQCNFPVSIDKSNPPNDSDIIICRGEGCGYKFGSYAKVKEAMIFMAKREIDNMIDDALGTKPTWTKG